MELSIQKPDKVFSRILSPFHSFLQYILHSRGMNMITLKQTNISVVIYSNRAICGKYDEDIPTEVGLKNSWMTSNLLRLIIFTNLTQLNYKL